jgi:hypothetical protein
MTTTEIEALGTLIMLRAGMPTHVTVLSLPWQPFIAKLRAQDQEARRIARMWRQEWREAVWNVPTQELETV